MPRQWQANAKSGQRSATGNPPLSGRERVWLASARRASVPWAEWQRVAGEKVRAEREPTFLPDRPHGLHPAPPFGSGCVFKAALSTHWNFGKSLRRLRAFLASGFTRFLHLFLVPAKLRHELRQGVQGSACAARGSFRSGAQCGHASEGESCLRACVGHVGRSEARTEGQAKAGHGQGAPEVEPPIIYGSSQARVERVAPKPPKCGT